MYACHRHSVDWKFRRPCFPNGSFFYALVILTCVCIITVILRMELLCVCICVVLQEVKATALKANSEGSSYWVSVWGCLGVGGV